MSDIHLSPVAAPAASPADPHWHTELRAIAALALPVAIAQVGMMTMGVVDTLMVGRVSARVLASVALGNLYFFNCVVLAMGTLMALDPIVAQAVGARDEDAVGRAVQRGLVLVAGLSVLTVLLMLPVETVLHWARQQPEVIPDAVAYVRVQMVAIPPFLAFVVLRQTLQATSRMAPIVWTIVVANLANAALNWVFIYGHLGSPPLGAVGSSIATAGSRWLMALMLLVIAWPSLRPHLVPLRHDVFAARPLARMLRLGLPIGAQQVLEIAAFGAVGLLMGALGTVEIAAHQIAINLAALTFMVPVGVAAAAAVRVGHAVGAGDPAAARRAAKAAFACGVGFMTTTAMVFLLAPGPLASAFTKDASVVALTAVLIPIAGVFQIFDGTQAVGAGVLRGIGDTRVPLIGMLAGYWLVGIPLSVLLGFHTALRARGLWWGFVASLATVALFLVLRIRVLFRRELTRVTIDEGRRPGRGTRR